MEEKQKDIKKDFEEWKAITKDFTALAPWKNKIIQFLYDGFHTIKAEKEFNQIREILDQAKSEKEFWTIFKEYVKPKSKAEIKRLEKQKIQALQDIPFGKKNSDFLPEVLPETMSPDGFHITTKEYKDQGTFTQIYEKDFGGNKTLYLRFPEIPIDLKGNVPRLAPMLPRVLLDTVKIAMNKKSYNFSFPKKDQLDLMGSAGEGEQFEQLLKCHQTWYYLDIEIKDKKNPGWNWHARVYNSFEHMPGKGGGFNIGINPDVFPILGQAFEDPKKLKDFRTLPGYFDQSILENQWRFITFLRNYSGLGKKVFPFCLKTVFERINIFYPDIQTRGIPWAIKELDKCLNFALEKNELIKWKYEPSKNIVELLNSLKAFVKKESIEDGGPLFLSDRLRTIHKIMPGIVKNYKKKGILIPKKLDPFDVFTQWKIHFNLGDKRQKELFEGGGG